MSRGRTAKFVAVVIALAAGAAAAGDLQIVSRNEFDDGPRHLVEPCIRNNAQELRHAKLKLGNSAVRWAYQPLPVEPGKTACFTLDASYFAGRGDVELELE